MHFNIINNFGNVKIVKDRYTDTFDVLVRYKSAYKFAQILLNKGAY